MAEATKQNETQETKALLLKTLENEGLADWRIESFGKIDNPLPAAFPGGPSHPAGSFIYPSPTLVRYPTYNAIGFITPSPSAMALNIAATAAQAAAELRNKIIFTNGVSPLGSVKSVTHVSLSTLFDFFEQSMIAVTFSFQSLEAFCNQIIQSKVRGSFRVQRKGVFIDLAPDDLERETSTEEKLATILPSLVAVTTPKGKKIWERFVKLKRVRDSTIHLKTLDAQSRLDVDSLYFQFLNHVTSDFPKTALDTIKYFRTEATSPLWMARIEEKIANTAEPPI